LQQSDPALTCVTTSDPLPITGVQQGAIDSPKTNMTKNREKILTLQIYQKKKKYPSIVFWSMV